MNLKKKQAFTLIEIAIALGIISFAMTGIVGLMMMGLTTLRSSMNTSVETRIAQQIFEDAQLADFGNLSARLRHFNVDGHEVAANAAERMFTADISFHRATDSLTHRFSNDLVKDMIVEIRNLREPLAVRTFSAVMVKNN